MTDPLDDLINQHPDPLLGPKDVIKIQLQSLANNDEPYTNAGVEICFRFASPQNKEATGPLENFIELVRNSVYEPMINSQHIEYGVMIVEHNTILQPVVVTGDNGEPFGYFFTLSRQDGGRYDRCWMTDNVVPFDVEEEDDEDMSLFDDLE